MTMTSERKYPSQRPEYRYRYDKWHDMGNTRRVPAWPVRRRLQALMAIGYTTLQLAEATGFQDSWIQHIASSERYTSVLRERDAKVREVYRMYYLQPCHNDNWIARRTRANSVKRGFIPPLAWNDIDDLNDVPEGHVGLNGIQCCKQCGRESRRMSRGLCMRDYQRMLRANGGRVPNGSEGLQQEASAHLA